MDNKQIDIPQAFDASIPHTIKLRSSQLRRERIIFAISILLPLVGFLVLISIAVGTGISLLDFTLLGSMVLVTVLGIEVGYHRLFSHHAFKAAQPIVIFLGIAGCMALQGPIVYWASNHRRHHAYSDRPHDPHSPYKYASGNEAVKLARLRGFWHAHIGWIFEAERTCPGRYGRDLLADPLIQKIDRWYFLWVGLGLAIPTLIGGLMTGGSGAFQGFFWGGLGRIFLVQQGTYCINSFCHCFGCRPFETGDQSANNICFSLLTLGGSLHNTHHAFPRTAVNGLRWWHLDISGWFILGLSRLGWAWDVQIPTPEMINLKRKK